MNRGEQRHVHWSRATGRPPHAQAALNGAMVLATNQSQSDAIPKKISAAPHGVAMSRVRDDARI